MAKKGRDPLKSVVVHVSTSERPDFKEALTAFVFDAFGELTGRVEIRDQRFELQLPGGTLGKARVFIAPKSETFEARKPTPSLMERMGAYEPVLQPGDKLVERIDIPGIVIDRWPFCFCWVRGKVVRASDNRAVCDARVHICEVDRIIWWITRLPPADIFRLRDDLIKVIQYPPKPKPFPDPDPGPFRPPSPGPDPAPFSKPLFRTAASRPGERVALNPQPLPPGAAVMFNPQPDPPRPERALSIAPELHAQLLSASAVVVRSALIENWKLLVPWFCLWPWWWWGFRCDEVAVVTTDSYGRFETVVFYPCGGDRPDLYFWVEYDFGSGFETVYHPWIACNTYWDYACGTNVTIRVTDPRVPGCEDEPDLPGSQVVVLSIGRDIAVRQLQTSGPTVEGLTTAGQPLGWSLEPRVDFSRTELIDVKGIPYYRWSYQRLSGPDGTSNTVDPASVPLNAWTILARDVYRHYKIGTSYPSDLMGPMPTAGPGAAPAPNLFRIRPLLPPAGNEWIVLNETVDLATAYFDTELLAGTPVGGPPSPDDLAAGRYELKLELFDAAGALVDWTTAGIDLRITDQDAPFGTGTITTSPAPNYNRVLVGGHTMGFRMVVRVDNNRCYAEILPVGGTVSPDPICGFHNYTSLSDVATESFIARHPNKFADYSFVTTRGPGPTIPAANTSGVTGEAGTNGFTKVSDFTYSKDLTVSTLLGTCSNAAFSERLDVMAKATNGYGTLTGYNHADNAAFALAVPCAPCDCEDGHGHGHGGGNA